MPSLEAGLLLSYCCNIGRVIFQRMRSYSTYAISVTVRLVLTFFLLTVIWDFLYPTLIIVILAITNDGTILTISRDRVKPSEKPDKWNLFGVI
jgi:H+-transporting ATPase